MSKISQFQKNVLDQLAGDSTLMKTDNDLQYALKGLLTEISHISTGEYFDPSYVAQKARLIKDALNDTFGQIERNTKVI